MRLRFTSQPGSAQPRRQLPVAGRGMTTREHVQRRAQVDGPWATAPSSASRRAAAAAPAATAVVARRGRAVFGV